MVNEFILASIPLPSFMITFKDKIIGFTVGYLQNLQKILSNHHLYQNRSTYNQIDFFIQLIAVVIIYWIIVSLISEWKQNISSNNKKHDYHIVNELNSIQKQIQSIKKNLTKINPIHQVAIPNQQSQSQNLQKISQIMQMHEKSLQSTNKIAQFMIETQSEIIKQLKIIKKSKIHSEGVPSHISSKQIRKKNKQLSSNKIFNQQSQVKVENTKDQYISTINPPLTSTYNQYQVLEESKMKSQNNIQNQKTLDQKSHSFNNQIIRQEVLEVDSNNFNENSFNKVTIKQEEVSVVQAPKQNAESNQNKINISKIPAPPSKNPVRRPPPPPNRK